MEEEPPERRKIQLKECKSQQKWWRRQKVGRMSQQKERRIQNKGRKIQP
jgi:hypothetical protein